jgi:periplasmic divalent cation tolerance protein
MTDYLQVLTATDRRLVADAIAQTLVEERLAACVQVVGPVRSVFRWQGAVETAEEWQCWIKTRRDLYPQVEAAVRRLHNYQTPEILSVAVEAGAAEYLKWLDEQVTLP